MRSKLDGRSVVSNLDTSSDSGRGIFFCCGSGSLDSYDPSAALVSAFINITMIKYAEKLVKICMNKERFVTFGAADSIYNFLPEDFFRQMSLKTKLNNLVDFLSPR